MSTPHKRPFVISEAEKADRARAGAPGLSVWVSANAGSGKTTLLTRRVIRLLAEGTDPRAILCLTYTKAAATEMQTRIFTELSAWVERDDAGLDATLADLLERPASLGERAAARRLFARVIETPGGLKLQTIHAFCERLLHLFPFEANVPARFTVLDEPGATAVLAEARRAVLRRADANPQSSLGRALAVLAPASAEGTFTKALGDAIHQLAALGTGRAVHEHAPGTPSAQRRLLGLGAEETAGAIRRAALAAMLPRSEWASVAETLRAVRGVKTADLSFAETLRDLDARARSKAEDDTFFDVFAAALLTKTDGTARKKLLTKAVVSAEPALAQRIADDALRVEAASRKLISLTLCEHSEAMTEIAEAVLAEYSARKRSMAAMDFNDLIERSKNLLSRIDSAWVLAKMDAAIDHVLVDEAQDTSAAMWQIIAPLTDDFFSGAGQRKRKRTIFAVGDIKQSIFSFQGASPAEFERMKEYYSERLKGHTQPLQQIALRHSFRTTYDILRAVDLTFSDGSRSAGLTVAGEKVEHLSARPRDVGLVEIWPVDRPDPVVENDPLAEVDAVPPQSGSMKLARRIARRIRLWCAGARHFDDGEPIRAGDVMILVRRRNAFYNNMIRALKDEGVPVAGADRLDVFAHGAVQDLLVAARAALLVEDDLALATALRSPLLGVSLEEVEALARQRTGSLFTALRGAESPALRAAAAKIEGWRALARMASPFRFFSELLMVEGGRKILRGRLGPDAVDAIDTFLSEAAAFESVESASLQAFVTRAAERETKIKREMEGASDRVRVMTVHGAKGLEARVVVMADTCALPDATTVPNIHILPTPEADETRAMFWASGKRLPDILVDAKARARAAEMAEYRRLLYVAMTRARDRLYIAGYSEKKDPPSECWYRLVLAGLASEAISAPAEDGDGTVLRFQVTPPTVVAGAAAAPNAPALESPPRPGWLAATAPSEPASAPPLRPSRVLDAIDHAGRPQGPAAARGRGIAVHRLLELLPAVAPGLRHRRATAFLRRAMPELDDGAAESLARSVTVLLDLPQVGRFFGPEARAELGVSGQIVLADGQCVPVSARIDRLVVSHEAQGRTAAVLDIKTGRPPRDLAAPTAHILSQLALYRALVRQMLAIDRVTAHVLWTDIPQIVQIPSERLDHAFATLRPGAAAGAPLDHAARAP